MDEPSDVGMLAIHPVYSTLTLPWTLTKWAYGDLSQKEKEEIQFRSAWWFTLSGAAYGTSWAIWGKPDTWPTLGRTLGVLGAGASVPSWARVAGGVGGAYLGAFGFYKIFMDPGSRFYISPDATVFGTGPGSIFGQLQSGLAETLVDLYESAV